MKGGLGEGLISGAKSTVNGMYQTIMNFFKRLTNKDEKDAEWRTCIIRYIVITVIVIGVCVMSISIMNNQDTASPKAKTLHRLPPGQRPVVKTRLIEIQWH